MIKVVKGTEAGYVYDAPVIVVSHQLTKTHIQAMLDAARAQFGVSAVIDMLVEAGVITTKESADVPYYCSVEGGRAPRMPHATIEKATAEAERLAKSNPQKTVRILRECGTRRYTAKPVTHYEMEMEVV